MFYVLWLFNNYFWEAEQEDDDIEERQKITTTKKPLTTTTKKPHPTTKKPRGVRELEASEVRHVLFSWRFNNYN